MAAIAVVLILAIFSLSFFERGSTDLWGARLWVVLLVLMALVKIIG